MVKTYSRKGLQEKNNKKKKDFEKHWRIMLIVERNVSTDEIYRR